LTELVPKLIRENDGDQFRVEEARNGLKKPFPWAIFTKRVKYRFQDMEINRPWPSQNSFLGNLPNVLGESFAIVVPRPTKAGHSIESKATKHRRGKNLGNCTIYADIEEPKYWRKWGIVGAIGPENWQQRNAKVCHHGKHHPPNHSAEYEVVDAEEINDETDKEEEEGKV
jgi:hypothetical protein